MSEPDLVAMWAAKHRGLVRLVLFVVYAVMLFWLVVKALNGASWSSLLSVMFLGPLFWQLGWYWPRRVDKWRDAQGEWPDGDARR